MLLTPQESRSLRHVNQHEYELARGNNFSADHGQNGTPKMLSIEFNSVPGGGDRGHLSV